MTNDRRDLLRSIIKDWTDISVSIGNDITYINQEHCIVARQNELPLLVGKKGQTERFLKYLRGRLAQEQGNDQPSAIRVGLTEEERSTIPPLTDYFGVNPNQKNELFQRPKSRYRIKREEELEAKKKREKGKKTKTARN